MKKVGRPVDSTILIYKNPRRIVFLKNKQNWKKNLSASFGNAFTCMITPLLIVVALSPFAFGFKSEVSGYFISFFALFYTLIMTAVNFLGFYNEGMAEFIPTLTWASNFWLYALVKKKKIIVKEIYVDRLSLKLPIFMFMNYQLKGDWANYKKISIKKLDTTWYFTIILNKFVRKGSMVLTFK
jgi:hypothetical protein